MSWSRLRWYSLDETLKHGIAHSAKRPADISWMGYYGFVSQYNRSLSGILRFTALKFSKYCPYQNISKYCQLFWIFKAPWKKTQKIYEGKTERPRKVERKWCIGVSKSWKFWDTAEMGGELLHIFINVHICVHVEMYIQIYISIYICVCIDLKLHTKYVCRSSLLMRRGLPSTWTWKTPLLIDVAN